MNISDHYKCILIGNSGTGKTSLLLQYIDKIFADYFVTTIGVDYKTITLNKNNKKIKLNIWDTAGQERFRSILTSHYRGANGVLLLYDLGNSESAEAIRLWLIEIHQHIEENIPIILVGNKSDLETRQNTKLSNEIQLTREIISNILLSHSEIINKECSAKTNEGVDEVFDALTDAMIRDRQETNRHINEQINAGFKLQDNKFYKKNNNLNESNKCC